MFAALAVYYIVPISPQEAWIFGFIGYSIPFLLIIHFLLLCYWLLKRSWKIFIPILALVLGWQHVRSTLQINPSRNVKAIENEQLKVINYNVRVFNVYNHLKALNPKAPSEMMHWLINQQADLLCLQEFYNDKTSSVFNAEERISEGGYPYQYILADKRNRIGAEFGLAIFSKLPIINKGVVLFHNEENNKAIYADVIYQQDTIRLYNVHLYSMKLKVDELIQEERESQKLNKIKEVFYRIRKGFKAHAKEAAILKQHILDSPYPVILAGDFNDLPYSYTYLTFSSFLQNSFEEAGNGLGFTFRGNPSFIRIDNQFSSKKFDIISHKVYNEINFSDHYPVSVIYDGFHQDKKP